nr:PREDICTED: uncharacterized protein LOC105664297 [Megachile rotundata]
MSNPSGSNQAHSSLRGLNISTLRRKRGNIIGQISSLVNFLDTYENSDHRDTFLLQTHVNGLTEVWKRFDDIQFNIEELDDSEEPRRFEIQNNYYSVIARANRLLQGQQSVDPSIRAVNVSPATTVPAPMTIKLPEMRLPVFDGTIEKWASFFDLFSSMIDRNEDLTPVQKLQYLRSTLTGKAAACIQALSTTDANYTSAIEILKEKFECTRRIVLGHCDALREIPKLAKDTAGALGDLVDSVNQHLRALENLGEKVSEWNSIVVSIILSKLNSETIWHWELTLKDKKKIPSFVDLLAFLEKRANCVPINSSKTLPTANHAGKHFAEVPHNLRQRPLKSHAFLTSKGQRNDPYKKQEKESGLIDLNRFWEIEEGPQLKHLSEAEKACEEHFRTHTVRNVEGRYIVALPFKDNVLQLGESKSRAFKRFISLERKLCNDKDLHDNYSAVIQEYLTLGHMSPVPNEQETNEGYYLPHHGVIKNTSDTTKLRVVFDGSAPTTSGISLNETLHIGPKIQDDLLYILLRFRCYRFVLTGDIEKMYRQFLVRPEDRKYQRILWRDRTDQIKTFELNTVTFGLSAAPYLAIRCLSQLAKDEKSRFPVASEVLTRDFYVDDLLTGTETLNEAFQLRNHITQLLSTAGLNIRQWASNERSLLQDLSAQDINKKLYLGESSTIKTLGVVWNSENDSIVYSVKTSNYTSRVTKRTISSEIAKIYDPLGLLGPVIVVAKILLQKIWSLKVDWDESLPIHIFTEWTQFYTQLPLLNNAIFPRKTIINNSTTIDLLGFCDASERAYGACIYLRSTDTHGHIETSLLVAKSKVAPLKSQTIPRLELCAAVLLTRLLSTVQKALRVKIQHTILWTDSMIVLHWLRTSPHLLKTFVANRVAEIQTETSISDWRHVSSTDNPADLLSRGLTSEEFLHNSVWRSGPMWLNKNETFWPSWELISNNTIPEQRATICLTTTQTDTSILNRFSSWTKTIRVVAFCLRWKQNNINRGPLNVSELKQAHDVIIKLLQEQYFSDEIRCIRSGQRQKLTGKTQQLNPFLDDVGILRVGGRLQHSLMPFSQKHPIILPKSRITKLIIENEHKTQLHAGTQATLYALRRRYWPVDGRSQVWRTVKTCVKCCRSQPPSTDYIMGNLPARRITESRPFANVGVDYCGPFYIKERRHRNRSKIKVYVAVFVCLAVKAIHLELVSDLTTEAFIAALRRFIARRGFCATLYSDNGSNFIGANNELSEIKQLLRSEDHNNKITTFLAERSIDWKFIPPLSPHFGGLWEAAVKSFKYHLRRVAGLTLFTFENLNTLIIEIEAILNSRPITPISSDANDLLALTPGHFLIGDSLTSLRERDFQETPANRLTSWQHVQKLKQHFWTRWHREYLNELTNRSKWSKGSHSIKEGTIVLLKNDNVPPLHWPLGRIVKVHPGSDGIIRTVTVKTATSTFDRNVRRLAPLPNQDI